MVGTWHKPTYREIRWDGKRNGVSVRILKNEGLKRCAHCKVIKFTDEFNPRGGGYFVAYCRDCEKARYQENVGAIREIRREYRLGVPPGTYEYLIAQFGAECSMCGTKKQTGTGAESNQFCIDHDHETDVVRGLLCNTCNVGIGMLQHSSKILQSGINYLKRPGFTIEQLRSLTNSPSSCVSKTAEELDL